MVRLLIFAMFTALCSPLIGQQPGEQADPSELEAQLTDAVGSERLDLLIELCCLHYGKQAHGHNTLRA